MTRWIRVTCFICVLATAPAGSSAWAVDQQVLDAERQRIDVIERISPSVVAIFGAGGGGGGSGVLISPDGYALTNFHVTSGAGDFMKCGLNDGKLYDGVIVGIDPTGDVALVKLLGREDFPFSEMGDSDRVKAGDWVMAIGNPFLLASDFTPTVTYGIVSGVHRYQYPAGTFLEYADCIQVDASINPGNSGGPLFNAEGQIIGINGRGSFEKRGRVNSGAGYAISINQIRHFLDHLKSGRIVDHATLGATVSTQSDGAVIIDQILPQSEAYRRGLREGDELVSFGGRSIRSVNQFKNILGIFPSGWKLPLVYRREGQTEEIYVRLRRLHSDNELVPKSPQEPARPTKPGEEQKSSVPEEYARLLVKKRGYSNYYFNQLNRERLQAALASWGNFADADGLWRLAGRTRNEQPFEFFLADDRFGLEIGKQVFAQVLEDGAAAVDDPPGTGGLLTAMREFQKLMVKGTDAFAESIYIGSEPLDGRGEKVDVLETRTDTVVTHWYFSKSSRQLVGFNTRLEDDVDECEVRFLETAAKDDRTLPRVFSVSSGGQEYATFVVERFQLARAEPR